jgi:hypothetical protein
MDEIAELEAEVREIQRNAWSAYKRGDITRADALDIIGRAEKDLQMVKIENLSY